MIDVVLASDGASLDLSPDDRLLRGALGERGLSTRVVPWTAESFDWTSTRCCLPRTHPLPGAEAASARGSSRDYDHWLGRVHELTSLAVPLRLARWNLHARYRVDLARKKVPVVATRCLAQGAEVELVAEMDERGAASVELAAARRREGPGRVFSRNEGRAAQRHLDRILAGGDAAITFDPPTGDRGRTRSLVFVEGGFSHAIVREPAPAGATAETVDVVLPREDEILAAQAALGAAPQEPLYARVDLRRDGEDEPHVVELDVVEGPLFLAWGEGSAERLAGALFARLLRSD